MKKIKINAPAQEETKALQLAYQQAEEDPVRKKIIADWSELDNKDWESNFNNSQNLKS